MVRISMKEKLKNLELLRKADRKKKKKTNYRWILVITISAFIISFIFSFVSESIIQHVNLFVGVVIALLFIIIGIVFDIIGVAITTADEKPFHSMSAQKVRGANIAVSLIKNASKVSSFCNDVIGDICGIVSGSAGIFIANNIANILKTNSTITTLLVTAIIAALTIGGKAFGKGFAINSSDVILYRVSKILAVFKKS